MDSQFVIDRNGVLRIGNLKWLRSSCGFSLLMLEEVMMPWRIVRSIVSWWLLVLERWNGMGERERHTSSGSKSPPASLSLPSTEVVNVNWGVWLYIHSSLISSSMPFATSGIVPSSSPMITGSSPSYNAWNSFTTASSNFLLDTSTLVIGERTLSTPLAVIHPFPGLFNKLDASLRFFEFNRHVPWCKDLKRVSLYADPETFLSSPFSLRTTMSCLQFTLAPSTPSF